MYCASCGHENPDGQDYCTSCGSALGAQGVPPVKKRRAGLIAGIAAGVVVVAGAAVAAVLLLGGSGAAGVWFSDDNGDVLRLRSSGSATQFLPGNTIVGEYAYSGGEGVLTLDGDDYDFTVDGDEMDIDDMGEYARGRRF